MGLERITSLGSCGHHSGDIAAYTVAVGNGRYVVVAVYSGDYCRQYGRMVCTVEVPNPPVHLSGKGNDCNVIHKSMQPISARDRFAIVNDKAVVSYLDLQDMDCEEWDDEYYFSEEIEIEVEGARTRAWVRKGKEFLHHDTVRSIAFEDGRGALQFATDSNLYWQ